ncbi:MAG: hypothetical protein ABIM30_00330 [candidate division WOR-3 bacterium]
MRDRAILKAIDIMGGCFEFSKVAASDSTVLQEVDDAFIKLAEENGDYKTEYKVASFLSDIISCLGVCDKIDVRDFITKAATAEKIYTKLASSNNIVEREMAELAKMHINSLFLKVAQIAIESGGGEHIPMMGSNIPHPVAQGIVGLMHMGKMAPEYKRQAERYKGIAMYGIPAAIGIGATIPYLVDKILGK